MIPGCPYCGNSPELVTGARIYPHRPDLHDRKFWACLPCEAWVGVHTNSPNNAPFGRLAKKELRQLKMAAHKAFDPLWKVHGYSRVRAYRLLSEKLGIRFNDCHIGMFDEKLCAMVPGAVKEILGSA